MKTHKSPSKPMKTHEIPVASQKEYRYNQSYLAGTYTAKIDIKKRIKIPQQLIGALIALNNGERKLYLKNSQTKIIGYTLSAVGTLRKELGELHLIADDTIKKMEEVGAMLYETFLTRDDRIVIPDEMLSSLDIKPNSDIQIKGAFEVITISKKQ